MAKEIKKTMEAPLAWINDLVGQTVTEEMVTEFTNSFCYKADGSTSTGPREVTILKDAEGEVLGRKCSITNKFFEIERFSKGATMVKEAEAVKAKLYTESKKMEKDAQAILEAAREIEDVTEKVAKFEEYDAQLLAAKEHRLQEVSVEVEGGVDTLEELASALGVEIPA